MNKNDRTATQFVLLAGDLIALGVVTVFGFASHGTAGTAGMRMLTTFVPLVVGWLLVAPFLGAYDPERAADIRQVWRPFLAMVLAGPWAAWLRGAWLGAAILPIFVVVLGGFAALGILAWRVVYSLVAGRAKFDLGKSRRYG